MRRSLMVALVLVGSLLVLPSLAGAEIKPGRSIDGFKIGKSLAQIEGNKGEPIARINTIGPSGEVQAIRRYPQVEVIFEGGNTVTELYTTAKQQKTKAGIGVGSRKRALRNKHKAVRCNRGGSGVCILGPKKPKTGQKITIFELSQGRILSVTIRKII